MTNVTLTVLNRKPDNNSGLKGVQIRVTVMTLRWCCALTAEAVKPTKQEVITNDYMCQIPSMHTITICSLETRCTDALISILDFVTSRSVLARAWSTVAFCIGTKMV